MNIRELLKIKAARRMVRFTCAATMLATAAISVQGPAEHADAAAPPVTNQRNFALGAPSTQSSSSNEGWSNRATDGWTEGRFSRPHPFLNYRSVTSTGLQTNPWWEVDLGASRDVDVVEVWNRTDCCAERLNDFWVFLSATPFTSNDPAVVAVDPGVTAVHITEVPNPSVTIPVTALARYVRVQLAGRNYLSLAEVRVIGQPWVTNFAKDAVVSQSSSRADGPATNASDGNADGAYGHRSVSHTRSQLNAWWQADVGHSRMISEVRVWNRTDCCADRLRDFWVQVSDTPFTSNDPAVVATQSNVKSVHVTNVPSPVVPYTPIVVPINVSGRYVRIQLGGTNVLSLAEVEINGPQLRDYVPGGVATQSTTDFGGIPENAQDGNTDGNFGNSSVTHTAGQLNPWWQVNLGTLRNLSRVKVWNRTDCCMERSRDFWVFLSPTPFTSEDPNVTANQPNVTAFHYTNVAPTAAVIVDVPDVPTQYLRVQIPGGGVLSLAEVEAFGTETIAPTDVFAWSVKHPFGTLLHYGLATFADAQWAPPHTPANVFNPPGHVDTDGWASTFKSAGMNWAAYTVKHHEGFAMWPTAYSNYSIAATPYQNGKGDLVRDYVNSMRAQNIEPGMYFSIWDRTNGETPALVKNQLRELLTHYGTIPYIFFDGWGAELVGPNKVSYNDVLDFVRNVSPNTVVGNNDARYSLTSSQFMISELRGGNDDLIYPKESVRTLDSAESWFWFSGSGGPFDAQWVLDRLNSMVKARGHLSLGLGPRVDGTFDPRYAAVLKQVGDRLRTQPQSGQPAVVTPDGSGG